MDKRSSFPFNIEIQFLAGLKKTRPNNESLQVDCGETISDIISRLGLQRDLVCAAILNEKFSTFDTRIEQSGTLKLLPAVGGG